VFSHASKAQETAISDVTLNRSAIHGIELGMPIAEALDHLSLKVLKQADMGLNFVLLFCVAMFEQTKSLIYQLVMLQGKYSRKMVSP
jgi:hypothetical protein